MTVVDKVVGALDKIAEVSTHSLFADPALQRHGKGFAVARRQNFAWTPSVPASGSCTAQSSQLVDMVHVDMAPCL